jgi:hypothetical protein
MTYYHNIKWDIDPKTKDHIFREVRSRIFFQNYYDIAEDAYIPLVEIIKTIGTEEDVKTIIDACKNWTKHKHTDMAIVSCFLKKEEIGRNPSVQKLLEFEIRNTVAGGISLIGGVLFHHGVVSFHT